MPNREKKEAKTYHDHNSSRNHQCKNRSVIHSSIPRYFLIFAFSGLNLKTAIVHFVHITGRLHIAKYVVLQLRHGVERVRRILILLNVADHLSRLGSLVEVDQMRLS